VSLFDYFRHNDAGTNIADRAGIISLYKHLRTVGQTLNHKLVERLSKDVFHEGGKKLGILQRNLREPDRVDARTQHDSEHGGRHLL